MINKSVYRNVESVESVNKGVILEYVSESKSGVKTISFFEFTGEGYVPEKDDAQSNFKCWKKVICDFWNAKAEESVFKADNGGIACKLRSTTPARAIIRGEGFEHVWKLDGSKWERIGLIPTKRDLEERAREYKKKMHRAAAASFAVAFGTQFEGAKLEEEA